MRTRLLSILIALILTGGAYPARAQDAGKIVEQYVKAAGGTKVLARIQTLTLEGTFTSDDGKMGTYTLDTKLPNRYYSELMAGEKNLIEAYNGKSAWHQNAAGELGTLVGPEGMQLEAAAQYYNSRLVNPKKSKIVLAFVGHAQVRGRDALQVEITTANGVKRQVFFDPQSHLIVKEAATVGGVDGVRGRRPGEEARVQRVHFFLSQRAGSDDAGEKRRQAAERRRAEERKRKDAETHRGVAEARDQERSQSGKGQGRREERREG